MPSLEVCEIYRTIQGESSYSGRPCVIVRLAGCNLNCTYCDTRYARLEGPRKSIKDVVKAANALDLDVVEVTGGEPLMQDDTIQLLHALVSLGKTVLLETNGSISIAAVPAEVVKILDIKCPESGESGSNRWENIALLEEHDETKFVLCCREDYDWARGIMDEHGLKGGRVLLSPARGRLKPNVLAQWMLDDGLDARLNLQLHCSIWPDGEPKEPSA